MPLSSNTHGNKYHPRITPEGCWILAPGETRGNRPQTTSTLKGWQNFPRPVGALPVMDAESGGSRFAPPPANILLPSGLALR
jgi:hypothetical protein